MRKVLKLGKPPKLVHRNIPYEEIKEIKAKINNKEAIIKDINVEEEDGTVFIKAVILPNEEYDVLLEHNEIEKIINNENNVDGLRLSKKEWTKFREIIMELLLEDENWKDTVAKKELEELKEKINMGEIGNKELRKFGRLYRYAVENKDKEVEKELDKIVPKIWDSFPAKEVELEEGKETKISDGLLAVKIKDNIFLIFERENGK